jgi:hydrogenase expression/formation protein HypD
MGYWQYPKLVEKYKVPIVIGGFEPIDLLESIAMLVDQLEDGRAEVENQYVRSARYEGNQAAQRLIARVFQVCDRKWRGIGTIPQSGLRLRDEYADFDAEKIYDVAGVEAQEPPECIAAQVLQGLKKPVDCAAFGNTCTPEAPLGAPMVSPEGACAAYYQYRRHTAMTLCTMP